MAEPAPARSRNQVRDEYSFRYPFGQQLDCARAALRQRSRRMVDVGRRLCLHAGGRGERIVRFFACGRDDLGRSRISILTYQWGDTPKLLDVTAEPVLDLGDAGCFDMDGVAYPYMVRSGGRLFMYYVGWNKLGGRSPWVTNLGLAVSDDDGKSLQRVSRAPIISRTNDDPVGSASSCAIPHDDGSWTLYYTKLLSWNTDLTPPGPCYNIWKARSTDGISWQPLNENTIPHDAGEYALCAPCLHRFGEQTVMFFFGARPSLPALRCTRKCRWHVPQDRGTAAHRCPANGTTTCSATPMCCRSAGGSTFSTAETVLAGKASATRSGKQPEGSPVSGRIGVGRGAVAQARLLVMPGGGQFAIHLPNDHVGALLDFGEDLRNVQSHQPDKKQV